ncbi:protein croquemort-like isoform X1 [Daphnia pulex]|uniref:protein croquemort-like isoform X1 n=2 Tax=Daphnia pulex TaxID=6669 RepID=UPI001EDC9BC3|nr:protein croquemort-like isoform X1 [Daphnia pulex]
MKEWFHHGEYQVSISNMGCCGPVFWGITGLAGAIIAATLAIGLPFLVNYLVDEQFKLYPGTQMYEFWEVSPVPMYIYMYLYNVTNAEDVINFKAKPILQQVGPYTYTEVHERVNIEMHDHNYTLKFQQKRWWQFVEERSNGSLEDQITTVNVPLLSAAYSNRFSRKLIKDNLNSFIDESNSTVFITKTADEFIFKGYSDPFLDAQAQLPPGLLDIPSYDKFGWFYGRNGSESFDGVFNIFTGVDDISKLDVMDMWNFTRQTKYYESYCGMVNGSFGEGWPPRRERTSISMYSSDLCRSITMDYTEDVEKNGVTFYRFAGTRKMFASVEEDPDNWCFCSGGTCNPSGVTNSTTCRYGSPAFVSFPHYYEADTFFQNQVEGLNPQKDLHQFHVDLEPRTATPLKVAARFQINILMQSIPGIDVVEDVREVYMPVIWFGVEADLSDKLLGLIHFMLIGPYIGCFFFFLMFVTCIIVVAKSAVKYSKMRKEVPPVHPEEEGDRSKEEDLEKSEPIQKTNT